MERIELPRFQVLRDESYGTSEESSRVVTPRASFEPSSTTTTGSIFSGVLNLSAAAVGVGIVALPYAFSLIGIWGGIVTVCTIGLITGTSLLWLLECSQLSKKLTFEGNVKFFLGSIGYKFFSANLVLLLFGGCTAMYMVSVSTVRGIWDNVLVDVLVFALTLGLCLLVMEDPEKRLGFASFLSIACVVYICGLLGLQAMNHEVHGDTCSDTEESLTVTNFVSSTSIVMNSFIMNFIFFEVISSIPRGPQLGVKVGRIVSIAIGLVIGPLYICISVAGIYGLSECGNNVPSNIFVSDRWSIHPVLLDSGRLSLTLVNVFKFPLLMLPLCHTLFPAANENRRIQILALLPLVVATSYLFGDISQVLKWIGTTCGIALGFIIPALMYHHLQDIEAEQADLAERIMTYHQSLPDTEPVTPSARRRAKKRTWKKWVCLILIAVSLSYALLGIMVDLQTRGDAPLTYFSVW